MLGRLLKRNLINIDLEENFRQALENLGFDMDELAELEGEQGLGMAGLGRLAACFLESLSSLEVPAWGYGIRYDYGSFTQHIDEDGIQNEVPDWWY